jgi:hypothetical protein
MILSVVVWRIVKRIENADDEGDGWMHPDDHHHGYHDHHHHVPFVYSSRISRYHHHVVVDRVGVVGGGIPRRDVDPVPADNIVLVVEQHLSFSWLFSHHHTSSFLSRISLTKDGSTIRFVRSWRLMQLTGGSISCYPFFSPLSKKERERERGYCTASSTFSYHAPHTRTNAHGLRLLIFFWTSSMFAACFVIC